MLTIGDFSKLSRVSVKTLRFYDEMGLFKTIEVDRFTGYRFYSVNCTCIAACRYGKMMSRM